jgi:hypothetical protein
MLAVVNWLVGWWQTNDDLADRLNEQATVLLSGCLTEASPAPRTGRRQTHRGR